MTQERLSNDEFLTRLSTFLSSTHAQSHGSIYLTQKPLIPTATTTDEAVSSPDSSSSSPQILIRASNGVNTKPKPHTSTSKPSKSKSSTTTSGDKQKIKFATVVDVSDLESFYARYSEICKKGMEGLRKRDKKKAKERAKAKKKGGKAGGGGGGS